MNIRTIDANDDLIHQIMNREKISMNFWRKREKSPHSDMFKKNIGFELHVSTDHVQQNAIEVHCDCSPSAGLSNVDILLMRIHSFYDNGFKRQKYFSMNSFLLHYNSISFDFLKKMYFSCVLCILLII